MGFVIDMDEKNEYNLNIEQTIDFFNLIHYINNVKKVGKKCCELNVQIFLKQISGIQFSVLSNYNKKGKLQYEIYPKIEFNHEIWNKLSNSYKRTEKNKKGLKLKTKFLLLDEYIFSNRIDENSKYKNSFLKDLITLYKELK